MSENIMNEWAQSIKDVFSICAAGPWQDGPPPGDKKHYGSWYLIQKERSNYLQLIQMPYIPSIQGHGKVLKHASINLPEE